MQFTQVLALTAAASIVAAQNTTVVTESDIATTVITITSCEEDKCHEVPVTTGLTVVTETVHGTVTKYTTYCPLPTTTKEKDTTSTKVVTSTSSTSNHTITTFEGAAARAVPAVAAVAAGVALLF